jgi:hypothetical protein
MSPLYTLAEDDLLLSLMDTRYPGGRSDTSRSFREIALLMNDQAPYNGITTNRIYHGNALCHHYRDYLRPKYFPKECRPTIPSSSILPESIPIENAAQLHDQLAAQGTASIAGPASPSEDFNLPNDDWNRAGAGPPYDSFPLCCDNPHHPLECFSGSASGCQTLHCPLQLPRRRNSPFTDPKKYDYLDLSEGKGNMTEESASMASEQGSPLPGPSADFEGFDFLDYYGVSKEGKMGEEGDEF